MSFDGPFTQTEWLTFELGLYDDIVNYDHVTEQPGSYRFTYPCLQQVRSGHTKVFPPRQTLGPPDPNVDDTLSSLNFMDLSGGQGVSRINISTDLNRFWWGTADTRDADGWTTGPEFFAEQPAVFSGNCVPIGRIGDGMYALWGTDIHQWDPDAAVGSRWGAAIHTVGTVVNTEGIVVFNDTAFFPLGSNGYSYVSESASRTLGAVTTVAGAALPVLPTATTNPKVWMFGVHKQQIYALTTSADGHGLASSVSGLTGTWFWFYNDAIPTFLKVNKSTFPHTFANWKRPDGEAALWVIGKRGGLMLNSGEPCWEETDIWEVPPHPNFGVCAKAWRPGEALWIASGGGDLLQYTASAVAQPGQGPGGRADGTPADKRGDIISMASDLANLYVLTKGQTTTDETSFVEDGSPDALVIATGDSVSTVIANTGKGWHPLWESSMPDGNEVTGSGTPTRIVVADAINDNAENDYRVYWGMGEMCWSMPCRLQSYSARQGRQQGIDRFTRVSTIEFGEFNAGSIAVKKLWSHFAILMDHAEARTETNPQYAELRYTLDDGTDYTFTTVAETQRGRTVFPLGLSDDGLWSSGTSSLWLKAYLRLVGPGGLYSPTVQALTLAFMPLPADASHEIFTIPLPVETDERTGKTREQIHDELHDMLVAEQMLLLRFGTNSYRAYVSGMSHSEIAGRDFVGTITLNVIQIPTGATGLVGEIA